MTSYSNMALDDLLDAFGSNEPVPGGGSAAALAGAVGASLLLMVAGLPKTLTGSPEEAADLAEASARLRPLRDTLTSLIERDSSAYRAVIEAMRLPKTSDADTRTRRDAIDAAMRGAIEVPMDTMRCCQQALRGALIVAQNGNPVAATDTGIGVELLLTGLRGAGMNVDVNARSVSDAAFVERVIGERAQLAADAQADARRARERLALL
jgi:glutamate formiminotransferase/formiminotetrahydrofolate cyclodeaminase